MSVTLGSLIFLAVMLYHLGNALRSPLSCKEESSALPLLRLAGWTRPTRAKKALAAVRHLLPLEEETSESRWARKFSLSFLKCCYVEPKRLSINCYWGLLSSPRGYFWSKHTIANTATMSLHRVPCARVPSPGLLRLSDGSRSLTLFFSHTWEVLNGPISVLAQNNSNIFKTRQFLVMDFCFLVIPNYCYVIRFAASYLYHLWQRRPHLIFQLNQPTNN